MPVPPHTAASPAPTDAGRTLSLRLLDGLAARDPEALRCVLFHDVAPQTSALTRGLGVTLHPSAFEHAVAFLASRYSPVDLDGALALAEGAPGPPRPLLVTFDDAYASVLEHALPVLRRHGIPALFFVNGAPLDNRRLALDNLVAYAANLHGLAPIRRAAAPPDRPAAGLGSLGEVLARFVPGLSPEARRRFHERLVEELAVDEGGLAREAGLYLRGAELAVLAAGGVEIASHTWSHARCRALDEGALREEIDGNRDALEALTGRPVRAFSVPYGSSADVTPGLRGALRRTGSRALFLVEGRPNPVPLDPEAVQRVSLKSGDPRRVLWQLEALPRLRALRRAASALGACGRGG